MRTPETPGDAPRRRACLACGDEMDDCACCNEPDCGSGICPGSLRAALREMVPPPLPSGG